jgi:hypothetical protein
MMARRACPEQGRGGKRQPIGKRGLPVFGCRGAGPSDPPWRDSRKIRQSAGSGDPGLPLFRQPVESPWASMAMWASFGSASPAATSIAFRKPEYNGQAVCGRCGDRVW